MLGDDVKYVNNVKQKITSGTQDQIMILINIILQLILVIKQTEANLQPLQPL